jgi:predicted AAA+ superfamily ATPase
LREDLLDLENVRNIKSIEFLVDLLAERVGSAISFASLARDLQVSPHTVKHWIQILENLFVIFVVPPFTTKIAKSILKEPKIYFYDIGRVPEGTGARLENLVAIHLLKRASFLADTEGEKTLLRYVRDKERREVDFVTVLNGKPEWLVEVKTSDEAVSKSLEYFNSKLAVKQTFQVVLNGPRERDTPEGIQVRSVAKFLAGLET